MIRSIKNNFILTYLSKNQNVERFKKKKIFFSGFCQKYELKKRVVGIPVCKYASNFRTSTR